MPPQPSLVSVVTPAYNEERHLRECIESILAQTYPHWDYTIVNNYSTDTTLDIAQEYAAKDHRIRIHNNRTFVDAVTNYNIAFRSISPQSKYCKVVGADDWIYPECLEKMVGLAERHPNVGIVGAYQLFAETLDPTSAPCCRPALQVGCDVAVTNLPVPTAVIEGREACRKYLLENNYLFGAPTPLLFRAEIVRNRQSFYEPNLHADAQACFEVLQHCDFGFVHQVLGFSRVRSGLTAYVVNNGLNVVGKLEFACKYGPIYLNKSEINSCIREKLALYYWYAGSQMYKRRGRKFWEEQRLRLAELGYKLSMPRVLRYALFYAIGAADQAARKAVKGMSRRDEV